MRFFYFLAAFLLMAGPLWAQDAAPKGQEEDGAFAPVPEAGLEAEGERAHDFENLLAQEDGKEFEFQGKTYVWRDGVPFEKLPDGSLAQVASPEGEGELYVTTPDGGQWLAQGADGSIYISVAPKIWAQLNFKHDSAELQKGDEELLRVFGEPLSRPPLERHRLILLGHTDDTGSEEYNLTLSRKRALAVANYLSLHYHIDPKRIIMQGYGQTRPVADNSTPEGRAKNRRVEFILLRPPK